MRMTCRFAIVIARERTRSIHYEANQYTDDTQHGIRTLGQYRLSLQTHVDFDTHDPSMDQGRSTQTQAHPDG
jgi:hypothetical protein